MRTGFFRPPVSPEAPRIINKEIAPAPPKEINEGEPASKIKMIGLPIIIVVVLAAMVTFMIKSGRFNMWMLLMPLILLVSMGGMLFGQKQGTGTSRAEILEGRKATTRGLGAKRELVFKYGLSMHDGLQWFFPDPQMLPTRAGTGRMWEVLPSSDSYSALRYGLGEVELASRVVSPEAPGGEFLEPVGWVSTVMFLKHHTTASSMPVAVTVTRFPVIGFAGDREVALGMLRAMLLHGAHTHGPDNLAIVVLTDDPDGSAWSWVKWLPHSQHPFALDRLGSQRMLYSDWSTLQDSLGGDDSDPDDPDRVIDFTMNFNPDLEIRNDDYRHVLVVVDSAVRDKLVDSVIAPRAGVTWLVVNPAEDSLTAQEGITFRCDDDGTVWRTDADQPLAAAVKVARADNVSLIDARTWARGLARYEVGSAGVGASRAPKVERGRDWQSLMRIQDLSTWDPFESWAMVGKFTDRRRLRIPIGFLDNADHLELDIKQVAEGGTGPHGLIIGTTGSGKSEFLRNMFANTCVQHSPDLVNWLLVDFKGGATFVGVEDVPHVTAVITNMEEEKHLVTRLREMIDGEIERRFEIFRLAKAKHPRADVQELRDYERLRERGADLAPLPALLILIDEFAELLQAHPDYGDIFKRIGRVGRSVGIHLIYASQNLDNTGRTSGLDTNQGYKIGLKTQTPTESRALLDGSDAAYKLPGTPGHGVLRNTAGELIHFYTAWTGAPYFPPEPAPSSDVDVAAADPSPAAAGEGEVRAFTAAGQPLPEGEAVAEVAPIVRTEAELDAAITVFTAINERLIGTGFHEPYRMWLPPLQVLTLDQVDPGVADWQEPGADAGIATMTVPIGLFDNPAKHSQPPWLLDTEANVLVLGDGGMGKSTALKSIVCSLALSNTPEQVQFYIIDYAGGGMGALLGLPHVGAVVSKSDPDGINRILTQMATLLRDREKLFREHKIDIDEYRRRRTDPNSGLRDLDPYGDVFVVIDGWDAAVAQDQVLQYRGGEVEALIVGARNYGLHFVVSTSRITEMRGMQPAMQTVIELHTSEMSQVGAELSRARRAEPGHAVTKTSKLQALVALPRIDGQADMVSLTEGTAQLVDTVAARFSDRGAERLKTLPTSLLQTELAGLVAAADAAAAADPAQAALAEKRRLRIAIGVREDTLGPAYAEMYDEPHLFIVGEAKTGKSEAISTFCDSVSRRFATIEEAAIVLIDPRRRHLDRVDSKNLFAHVHRAEDIKPALTDLYGRFDLGSRSVPPNIDAETRAARSWWSGPEIFIVVDDYHLAADASSMDPNQPMYETAPWLSDEPLARGYHFVLARSSNDLFLAGNRDPLVKRLLQDRAPTVMLSADRFDGNIGEYKFERFGLPGRGRYVQAALARAGRIQLAWSGVADISAAEFED